MERSEPTLAPQWLKSSGSINGSGNANHHSTTSSSSHSDNHGASQSIRNRSSLNTSEYDSPRSFGHSDRTTSAYFSRSSSINGSVTHERESSGYTRSYSSRSHRDRDRDRDWDKGLLNFSNKERSFVEDDRDHNYSTPLGISANSLTDKDPLRRSRSLISGKRGEAWSRRVSTDVNSRNKSNHSANSSSVVGTSINGIVKTAFEKDFPSLGAEERQGASEIPRFSSPGLSSAVKCLPTGPSAGIGGDGWTSALAEVPVIIGNNSVGISSSQQSSSGVVAPTTSNGLNMAETLAQAPARIRTVPQLSVETQRLEELAIKQSRQLIPMTPSMAKTSVLNAEKPKSKPAVRSEMSLAAKIGQKQALGSGLVAHSSQAPQARSDAAKTGHAGKLFVLNPAREKNGSLSSNKDGMSPTNVGGVTNNPSLNPPTPTYASVKNSQTMKLNATELHKPSSSSAIHPSSMEKRPTLSQFQSRNDFFNLMRKKTSTNSSSVASDASPMLSSTNSMHSGEPISEAVQVPQVGDAPKLELSCVDCSRDNVSNFAINGGGDACNECERCPDDAYKHSEATEEVYSDEREIEFLRSLGWNEDSGEGGLTEEEINAFFKEHGEEIQQKIPSLLRSHAGSSLDSGSSVFSSDPESDI
ncbi:hypothetical protein Syun_003066 [Stephania yunnanensis]|uniref:Uncharacterized protein n=1 Tax=Stephania yunnanensis TaxID=152371 RepID=A0AAP0L4C5_9MAGN